MILPRHIILAEAHVLLRITKANWFNKSSHYEGLGRRKSILRGRRGEVGGRPTDKMN